MEKGKIQDFLKRLAALSEETGVVIQGCGCCGSPSLQEIDGNFARPVAYYSTSSGDDVTPRQRSADNKGVDQLYEKYWTDAAIRSTED